MSNLKQLEAALIKAIRLNMHNPVARNDVRQAVLRVRQVRGMIELCNA